MSIEGCTAGIYLPFEGVHTGAQNSFIAGATTVATGLQTGLVDAVDGVGLAVEAVDDAVNALVALADPQSSILSDPTVLLGGSGPFASLLSSLPAADQFSVDIDAISATILDPCNASGDIGQFASDICAGVNTALEDAIMAIETVVNDIEGAVDDVSMAVDDFFMGLDTVLSDAQDFATNAANTALSSAETFATAQATAVCNDASSVLNSIKNASINLGSIGPTTLFNKKVLGVRVKVEFPRVSLGTVTPFSFLSGLSC